MASGKCAICGKVAAPAFQPFCSKRCADIDLARWITGHYRIPAEEPPEGFGMDRSGLAEDDDADGR